MNEFLFVKNSRVQHDVVEKKNYKSIYMFEQQIVLTKKFDFNSSSIQQLQFE